MEEQYTDYFGFDLGDGESAIAWMRPNRRIEPQMIELRGRKSIISAIGEHLERGMLIGEEACHTSGLTRLDVRFKSRYLTEPDDSGEQIERFAGAILETLVKDSRLERPETACFFIGCPSGWSADVRDAYKKRFVSAGMIHCEVISESRAAFMFARESGELRVSDDLLTRPTLIIDAGSSTTDFTYVADLTEKHIRLSDFGESRLGGGLIDRLVLEASVRQGTNAEEIAEILNRYPAYAARCEFEARRVKEMYFTQQMRQNSMKCESAVKLYVGRTPVTVEISVDDERMRAILRKPLPELGGRSFAGAYQTALRQAREQLKAEPPETILLTGGASRMPIIEETARKIFPDAQVLRGLEPEYAIARGLCHALRIDRKTKGFSEAVDKLIRSDDMEEVVMRRLGDLYEAVSAPIVDRLTEELGPEAFKRWRRCELCSINDISDEIARRTREMMGDERMKEALRPVVEEWLGTLKPEIEKMTDPICDEFDLPRTSLRLPDYLTIPTADIRFRTGQFVRMDELKAAVDMITGTILASILGGSGMALLAAGLPGVIAGFAAGILVGIVGTETAEKVIWKAELPVVVRRLFTESKFRRTLNSRKSQIRKEIADQLIGELHPPTETAMKAVRTIAESIEEQLDQMMRRATLLIH